jgi:hypothetical protein
MAEESVLPVSPAPDFSDRVDALLSSALAEQAREKRQLVDTLYGAKAALVKAEEEISALRQQITTRDEDLVAAIDKKFEERIEAIEEALIKLARSVGQVPARVRADIETAAVAVGERMGEECDALLRNMREDAVEVVSTIGKLSERSLGQTQNAIEGAREEYRTTTEQVVKYLGQRDDALQTQRDRVLIDLFRQLGESLGKRNAKKVAKAVAADPDIGRRPPPAAVRQSSGPPPHREPPAFRAPIPGGPLGESTSIASPPRFRPPGVPAPESREREDAFEGPEPYGAPPPGPAVSSPTGTMAPVSGYEPEPPRSSPDASSRVFGPIIPDEESKPRRARRKPKEAVPPKSPKPATKRAVRRKPPV